MTRSLRDSRLCLTAAALCAGTGAYFATQHSWLCLPGFYTAAFLAWCGSRLHAEHRRQMVWHERARRTAALDEQALNQTSAPTLCCSFWQHSDGEVHGPGCTRPSYARYDDYRLDPGAAAAFEEISAHFDDQEAA